MEIKDEVAYGLSHYEIVKNNKGIAHYIQHTIIDLFNLGMVSNAINPYKNGMISGSHVTINHQERPHLIGALKLDLIFQCAVGSTRDQAAYMRDMRINSHYTYSLSRYKGYGKTPSLFDSIDHGSEKLNKEVQGNVQRKAYRTIIRNKVRSTKILGGAYE